MILFVAKESKIKHIHLANEKWKHVHRGYNEMVFSGHKSNYFVVHERFNRERVHSKQMGFMFEIPLISM